MNLRDLLKKIKDLPTISAVAAEINTNEKMASLTARTLGEIIARDPALTSKVLKIANSAYYGMPREISTLDRAVTILGFDTIKNLALTISVFHTFKGKGDEAFDLKGLWYHSLAVGLAAKQLVIHSPTAPPDKALPELAFICGILHDIGKIAIAQNLPKEAAEIAARTQREAAFQYEIEKEILGFNHQRVGQALADQWNFPEDYLTVIRLHHAPLATAISDNQQVATLVMAAYLGNKMAKALHLGTSSDPHMAKVLPEDLRLLGLTSDSLLAVINSLKSDYQNFLEEWKYE